MNMLILPMQFWIFYWLICMTFFKVWLTWEELFCFARCRSIDEWLIRWFIHCINIDMVIYFKKTLISIFPRCLDVSNKRTRYDLCYHFTVAKWKFKCIYLGLIGWWIFVAWTMVAINKRHLDYVVELYAVDWTLR